MTPPTATSSTLLTARTPEDLLAAAAVVLGFWPTESVVMLTFDATHPFHARVDLPDEPTAMAEVASLLARPAVRHQVGRVVLLIHSASASLARAAWSALCDAFGREGIRVVEALHVDDGRYYPLLDDDACRSGVPFDPAALSSHPFLAQAVVDGRVLHGSRRDLAASLAPDGAAVARVGALVAGVARRHDACLDRVSTLLAEGTWAHDLVRRHVSLPEPVRSGASDSEVARLLSAMRSLRVRDAAWSAITRQHARPAVGFFADVVRRAPFELVPAPAALLAWAAWQAGDGALAWCALDRCNAVDPAYGLAALIGEALERAVPPSVMAGGFDWKEGLDGRDTG